jgi:hypothetical protein
LVLEALVVRLEFLVYLGALLLLGLFLPYTVAQVGGRAYLAQLVMGEMVPLQPRLLLLALLQVWGPEALLVQTVVVVE